MIACSCCCDLPVLSCTSCSSCNNRLVLTISLAVFLAQTFVFALLLFSYTAVVHKQVCMAYDFVTLPYADIFVLARWTCRGYSPGHLSKTPTHPFPPRYTPPPPVQPQTPLDPPTTVD